MGTEIKYKKLLIRFVLIFVAVLVFTLVDYLFHAASPYLSVPFWYYRNKMIYGSVLACLASLFFQKYAANKQALFVSSVTVVLLQIRYALYGYTLLFHSIVMAEHFVVLYFCLLVLFKFLEKKRLLRV